MENVLDVLFYIYEKFLEFMFNSYIVEGVSLGMLSIAAFVFIVLLRFVVAIPRIPIGDSEMRSARLSLYREQRGYYKDRRLK